jgi:hypothetical protein
MYVFIMVEGPGATRNGRKAQAAVGCTVEAVALPSTCDVSKSNALNEHLIGCILCEAFSVGKEVFLIFLKNAEEVAVRLHFGMNGCLYCAQSISVPPWKQEKEATIRMTLIKPRRAAVDTENTITNFTPPSHQQQQHQQQQPLRRPAMHQRMRPNGSHSRHENPPSAALCRPRPQGPSWLDWHVEMRAALRSMQGRYLRFFGMPVWPTHR